MGKYNKAIVAMIGAVVTVLQTVFPAPHWSVVTVTILTAVLVWLTPNSGQSPRK